MATTSVGMEWHLYEKKAEPVRAYRIKSTDTIVRIGDGDPESTIDSVNGITIQDVAEAVEIEANDYLIVAPDHTGVPLHVKKDDFTSDYNVE